MNQHSQAARLEDRLSINHLFIPGESISFARYARSINGLADPRERFAFAQSRLVRLESILSQGAPKPRRVHLGTESTDGDRSFKFDCRRVRRDSCRGCSLACDPYDSTRGVTVVLDRPLKTDGATSRFSSHVLRSFAKLGRSRRSCQLVSNT